MTLELAARARGIKPSATLEIDALAKQLKAQGQPVISFTAGEPDFDTPKFITDAATAAVNDPNNYKYTPATGLPELRSAIAKLTNRIQKLNDAEAEIDPTQVVVTNGGKQAVFEALATILDPGDVVLLPTPLWLTYQELITYFGATYQEIPGLPNNDYKVTAQLLEDAVLALDEEARKTATQTPTANNKPKLKAIILNSPNNPTGSVYTADELKQIGEFAKKHDLYIITDEIYEYLVYNNTPAAPHILEVDPTLANRTIIINGVAKAWSMTGWRVGWAIAPTAIAKKIAALQGHLTSNVNNIAQRAALAAVTASPDQIKIRDNMCAKFNERGKLIAGLLRDIKVGEKTLKISEAQGAFYAFVDIRDFTLDANEFAKNLLEQVKVAVVPMDAFSAPGHIRLSYALSEENIREGVKRIAQFLSK